MKLRKNKNNKGYLSNYTLSISINEAKECGFITKNGELLELKKIIDKENKKIFIKTLDNT